MAAELKLTVTPVANSADVANNTSQVRIVLQIITTDGTYNLTGSTAGSLKLDGAEIASLAGKKVQQNTTTTLYSATRTVSHGPDGTRRVVVEAAFDVDTSVRWIYAEKTVDLPPISRCGTLAVGEFTTGEEGTLTITPAGEEFIHAVYYAIGSRSGTAVPETAATELTWTPPMDLANEIPDSAAGYGTLTLVSYLDGVETGRRDCEFTLRISPSAVPTVSLTVTVESDDAVIAGWGVAVKGRSRLRYALDARGAWGSQIVQSRFTFGQQTVSGLVGTLVPAQSGSFAPSAAITDSRGRIADAVLRPMDVYDYSAPVLTTARAWRCDEQGLPDDDGAYAAVVMSGSCSAVGGRNTLTLRCRYRSMGGTWSGETYLTGGETLVLPGFDPAASYEVELAGHDTVGEEKVVLCTIPTASAAFVLAEGGVGAAFGKYPEQPGLDMGWGIWMNGHSLTGLPEPVSDTDAAPWGRVNFQRIYPVGSLYLTVADTDPAALFGGVWQRIRDVFLLAAGDAYPGGSTGGEAEHTLTEAELPHVEGSATFRPWGSGNPVTATEGVFSRSTAENTALGFAAATTENTARQLQLSFGADQAHNNMPPYLAVNVWQRTA